MRTWNIFLVACLVAITYPLCSQALPNEARDNLERISRRLGDIGYEMGLVSPGTRAEFSTVMFVEQIEFDGNLQQAKLRIEHLELDSYVVRRLKRRKFKDDTLAVMLRAEFVDTQKWIRADRTYLTKIASRAFGFGPLEDEAIRLMDEAEYGITEEMRDLGF